MIRASQLTRRFGRKLAVDDVTFEVDRGRVVGFLGNNGAGKTTTMRLLTGVLRADAGSSELAGFDIAKKPADARAALGYLPEAATGFSQLTVLEFLTFCAEARGLWANACRRAIERACEAIELNSAMHQPLANLSKGWRQRAWLAQAILHDPPVLILDEPTDGLDPGQKTRLRKFIRSIASEKTILMSTHILEEAEQICDRVIVLSNGRVVADEPLAVFADGSGRIGPAYARATSAAATSAAATSAGAAALQGVA